MIEVKDSYKTIFRKDIGRLEKDLSINFPDEYVEFILKHNGGCIFPDGVKVNGEHFDFVSHLYAIRNEMAYDDLLTKINEYSGMILEHYLPFGESPGGDVFCFSLLQNEFGSVYHWDHEQANYDGDPWEYNMTLLASSFNEFIESLYECE